MQKFGRTDRDVVVAKQKIRTLISISGFLIWHTVND